MISDSRVGASFSPATCRPTSFFQSGIFDPRYAIRVSICVTDTYYYEAYVDRQSQSHVQGETRAITRDTWWNTFSPRLPNEKQNLSANSLILPRGINVAVCRSPRAPNPDPWAR